MFVTWILTQVYLLCCMFWNNSGRTCYYQLTGFLFHLRLHLAFGINTRLTITNYHDNHSHLGIQFTMEQCQHVTYYRNYQDNNSHTSIGFYCVFITHVRNGLFRIHFFWCCNISVLTIKLVISTLEKLFVCQNSQHGRVSKVSDVGNCFQGLFKARE